MPKRFAAVLAALLAILLLHPAARADDLTPEKAADIKRLFEVTGSANLGRQYAETLTKSSIGAIKAARPDLDKRALDLVQQEIFKLVSEKLTAPGGLQDRLVPVYSRLYTHAEIRELLAFYATPLGQKTLRAAPELLREGQKIGAAMAQELGPELRLRINEALFKAGVSMQGGAEGSNPPGPGK